MTETEARRAVKELTVALKTLVDKDPEQEVRGPAVGILDAVIVSTKELFPNHPVVRAIPDAISPEAVADSEPLRAADALIIAHQLQAAIGPARPRAYSQTGRGRRIPGM